MLSKVCSAAVTPSRKILDGGTLVATEMTVNAIYFAPLSGHILLIVASPSLAPRRARCPFSVHSGELRLDLRAHRRRVRSADQMECIHNEKPEQMIHVSL